MIQHIVNACGCLPVTVKVRNAVELQKMLQKFLKGAIGFFMKNGRTILHILCMKCRKKRPIQVKNSRIPLHSVCFIKMIVHAIDKCTIAFFQSIVFPLIGKDSLTGVSIHDKKRMEILPLCKGIKAIMKDHETFHMKKILNSKICNRRHLKRICTAADDKFGVHEILFVINGIFIIFFCQIF